MDQRDGINPESVRKLLLELFLDAGMLRFACLKKEKESERREGRENSW
jgi:hypothetical protein